MKILPQDPHDLRLLTQVAPSDWGNPKPLPRYDLVVVGAGTAGLVTAAGAAGLGARVALVERHLLGGDCLNAGCVPSKALIRAARAAFDGHHADPFGVRVVGGVEVDFAAVMERVRRLRADISIHDSAARFRDLGVDVFLGEALFVDGDSLTVAGNKLRFRKAVLATGARAVVPAVEGLASAGCLTNETVFTLTECPRRLAVIGGGPLGCELAQAFQRLGSQVVMFHRAAHLLEREDADAAAILQQSFVSEGIELRLQSQPTRVELIPEGKVITYECDGQSAELVVDEILVGAGRAPNVEGLNLEGARVQYDPVNGVHINHYLQSSNPRIYAAGDVALPYKFTHMADACARIVIQNALFLGRKRWDRLVVPWCTYTDPEIAHVGHYERDALALGIPVDTYVRPLSEVDRAVLDGESEGFVKVHIQRGTDRILGATIVARHAGEMINEISLAMVHGLGLKAISQVVHPYPTQAEAIRQVADTHIRKRLTRPVKKMLGLWLNWARWWS